MSGPPIMDAELSPAADLESPSSSLLPISSLSLAERSTGVPQMCRADHLLQVDTGKVMKIDLDCDVYRGKTDFQSESIPTRTTASRPQSAGLSKSDSEPLPMAIPVVALTGISPTQPSPASSSSSRHQSDKRHLPALRATCTATNASTSHAPTQASPVSCQLRSALTQVGS